MTTDIDQLFGKAKDALFELVSNIPQDADCKRGIKCDVCAAGQLIESALDTLVSRLKEAEAQLEWQEAALRHFSKTYPCPCGAWLDDLSARPHAPGCPVEAALSTPPNQDASSVTPAAADGSATKERLEPEVSPRRSEPSNLARDAAGVTPEPRYLCDNCFAGDRSSLECAERGHTGGRMRWPTPPNQEEPVRDWPSWWRPLTPPNQEGEA